MRIRTSNDLDEGARLWEAMWPADDVFSSWEVRMAFQRSYGRAPLFLIAENERRPRGFIALSRISEEGYFGAFPGETCRGRTWLEQNRVPADSGHVARALWEAVPSNTVLRYLHPDDASLLGGAAVDETGYVFDPGSYGYDFERYWLGFSGKSRKKLARDLEPFRSFVCGPSDSPAADIDWMIRTNLSSFGDLSYFSDERFAAGFEEMLSLLSSRGRLVVTSVRSRGRKAAVDVAAVFGRRYTVLAGATSPEFPGVAKLINLHHLRWSCEKRMGMADFLCGDFGWKARFHLTPRDLYVKCGDPAWAGRASPAERVSGI